MELSSFVPHHYHCLFHYYPHFDKFVNRKIVNSRFLVRAAAANVNSRLINQKPRWKSQDNPLSKTQFGDNLFEYLDVKTCAFLLEACTNIKSLHQLHARMFTSGLNHNLFLQTKLLSKYAICGSMHNARLVFDKICSPNIFLWNVMITEYTRNGQYEEAFALYYQIQRTDMQPDKFTFTFVLKACGGLLALQEGKGIHNHIVRAGLDSDVFVGNSLVAMYAKCGTMKYARQMFDKMSKRDVISWNTIIVGCAHNGHANEALTLFDQMHLTGVKPNSTTLVSVLHSCAQLGALQQGKWIHNYIAQSGFEQDVFVGNSLIDMYCKCGSIETARNLFDTISKRDVISWNAMITGYAQNGHAIESLALFNQMRLAEMKTNSVTMVSVVTACGHLAALRQGKWLHGFIIKNGFESDDFVGTALIRMYGKCGRTEFACQVFDKLLKDNVVSWNAIITEYAQIGLANEALGFFNQLRQAGTTPNSVTMVSLLQACAHLGVLHQGKEIHAYIIQSGFESNVFVENSLVAMYAKCGIVEIARQLFDKMPTRNIVSWNAIIAGYAQNGHAIESLTLFNEMQMVAMKPDSVTLVAILQACAHLAALQQGKWIHGYIIKIQFELDIFVGTAIVDMYAKCGNVDFAWQFFEKMSNKNVVSWNAMLAGYVQNGRPNEALALFNQLQQVDMMPDSLTMVSVLQACTHLGALHQGMVIHGYIIGSGFESDVSVVNSLITMYAKCGDVEVARQLFDKLSKRNVVSWNAMISGYAQNKHANMASMLFNQMQWANMMPDSVTMVSVVQACAHLGALQEGKWIHGYIIRSEFELDITVGTALIDMYAKCRSIKMARQLFDKMSKRNAVTWSVMIAGYAHNGHANEAFTLFNQMQLADMKPDSVTMVSMLPVCGHLSALQQGKWIHGYIIKSGLESDVFVMNSLIDMYAKCGSVDIAHQLFDRMFKRDVGSWNAMIAGYGIHGHGKDALALFWQMQQTSMKPNDITFISILSACSHAGLVDEGWQYFDCMVRDYGIMPRLEHYACMVDLLGRAGCLDDAQHFIENMPIEPDATVWGALLGACRIHCNIELGEHAAECLFNLEPENAGCYVLLSNMYAAVGRWDDVAKVRTMMKNRGLKKVPGCSLIEANNMFHAFLAGDTTSSI